MKLINTSLFAVLLSLSIIAQGDNQDEAKNRNEQVELGAENSNVSSSSIDERKCKHGDIFSGYSGVICECVHGRWMSAVPGAGSHAPCKLPRNILPSVATRQQHTY